MTERFGMADETDYDVLVGEAEPVEADDVGADEATIESVVGDAPEAVVETVVEAPTETTDVAAEEAVEETPLLAKKFKEVGQLETAYENAQRELTRQAQELADFRRQQKQAEVRPQAPAIDPQDFDPTDPEHVQAFIAQEAQRIASEQLRPIHERQTSEIMAQRQAEIIAFKTEHPESASFEPDILRVVQTYRYDDGEEVFPPTKQNLEAALTIATNPKVEALLNSLSLFPEPEYVEALSEVAQNPALEPYILANPQIFTNEASLSAGMQLARQHAQVSGLPQALQQATTQATQQAQQKANAQKAQAFVETETMGAPTSVAPGDVPADVRDLIGLDLYQSEKSGRFSF